MKYFIILVIVLGVILGGITYTGDRVLVQNPVPSVVEKIVEKPDPLTEQIRAREAELDAWYAQVQTIEAERDVLLKDIEAKQLRVKELNKELATFMTASTSRK